MKYKKHIATGALAISLFVGGNAVGTVSNISNTGFTMNIKNERAKTISSIDVKTDTSTRYSKNGMNANLSDISTGQKIIAAGNLDKTANILAAKKIKIVIV